MPSSHARHGKWPLHLPCWRLVEPRGARHAPSKNLRRISLLLGQLTSCVLNLRFRRCCFRLSGLGGLSVNQRNRVASCNGVRINVFARLSLRRYSSFFLDRRGCLLLLRFCIVSCPC